jgi:hypothetical protein
MIGEKLQWGAIVLNTVHSIIDTFGTVQEKMPETWKQRLPGFLGLSLKDEQIFNGVRAFLTKKRQVTLTQFLKRCKDYERNRFINIVAGMEVSQEKLEESEKKYDKEGNLIYEKKKSGSPGIDCRLKFLNSFTDIILNEYGGDLDKAYEYCIAGRMIVEDPLHQKTLRTFSSSTAWFKKNFLEPLEARSLSEFIEKATNKLSVINDSLEDKNIREERKRKPLFNAPSLSFKWPWKKGREKK